MFNILPRRALFAALFVGLSSIAVAAQPSATGLGQAWPNSPDVSASPQWHVYVFTRDGIRYIQINDLGGNVLAAFATANGQFLVLPVGRDAQHVSTPQHPLAATNTASAHGEKVYLDASTQITVLTGSDGSLVWMAQSVSVPNAAANASQVKAADCDGDDCGINHVMTSNQPQSTNATQTQTSDCDGDDCGINHVQ
jgi:hypothetical protein